MLAIIAAPSAKHLVTYEKLNKQFFFGITGLLNVAMNMNALNNYLRAVSPGKYLAKNVIIVTKSSELISIMRQDSSWIGQM